MKTSIKLLAVALVFNSYIQADVTYDFTGKAGTFDGQTSVNVSIFDTATSASTLMTVSSTGAGNLNSNSGTFGVDSTLLDETAANIDGTGEAITLIFDKNITLNFIDFNSIGGDLSTGTALTIAGTTYNLFDGVTGLNANDLYTPSSPISVTTSDSIVITGSGASSSFYIQNFNITVVPEPNTYALLAGVSALGFVMMRRRTAK